MDEVELSRTPRLLVGLDFDGTLAPIASTADRARILPESARSLDRLAAIPGTTVAILSGRDLSDLSSKVPGSARFWLGGSHGRALIPPGGDPATVPPDPRLDHYRTLTLLPGVRRELKDFSVAFHWRGRTGGEPIGWIKLCREQALRDGLEVMDGRMVLEILIPGVGKDDALGRVAKACDATAIFFAGDDRTDLEAIQLASGQGKGIFVHSAERSWMAPEGIATLDGPEELASWLGKLAEERGLRFEAATDAHDAGDGSPSP